MIHPQKWMLPLQKLFSSLLGYHSVPEGQRFAEEISKVFNPVLLKRDLSIMITGEKRLFKVYMTKACSFSKK